MNADWIVGRGRFGVGPPPFLILWCGWIFLVVATAALVFARPLFLALAIVAPAAGLVVASYRLARLGAWSRPDGLVICEFFSTTVVGWADIEQVRRGPSTLGSDAAWVVDAKGEVHRIGGTGTWLWYPGAAERLDALVPMLVEEVRRRRKQAIRSEPGRMIATKQKTRSPERFEQVVKFGTWIRTPLNRVLVAVLVGPSILLCLIMALASLDPSADIDRGIGLVGSAVFGTFFLWIAVRLWNAGLLPNEEGIVVRRDFRTESLRWDEIAEFFVPPHRSVLYIRRRDGSVAIVRSVAGLNPDLFRAGARRVRAIAESLEAQRTRMALSQ